MFAFSTIRNMAFATSATALLTLGLGNNATAQEPATEQNVRTIDFLITDDGIVPENPGNLDEDGPNADFNCSWANDVGGPKSSGVCNYRFTNTLSLGRNIDFTASENLNGVSLSPLSGTIANGSSRTFAHTTNNAAISFPTGVRTGTSTFNFSAFLYSETKTGSLRLTVRKKPGDDLGSATLLGSGLSGSWFTSSNSFYTNQTGEPKHYPGATANNVRSRWYRWVAPSSGQMKFWTEGSSGLDTVMAVYNQAIGSGATSSFSNLGKVGSDDNSQGGNKSAVWFHAQSGEVYYIAVASRSTSTTQGFHRLRWSRPSGTTTGLVASLLPRARGVRVNTAATAFGTIINTSSITARNCYLSPFSSSGLRRDFQFQTTTSANTPTGFVNRPINIPPGGSQNYVFGYTPQNTGSALATIVFDCENMAPAPASTALNAFRYVSGSSKPADMVAAAVTTSNDGIVRIPSRSGTGVFSVAVLNNDGPPTSITAQPAKVGSYPANINICRTNPSTGACITPIGPAITWTAQPNQPYTFTVFVTATGNIPFAPATNRVDLQFRAGTTIHGLTGVAVRTP